jgi:hypothetical protein
MSNSNHTAPRARNRRSEEQRQGSTALRQVMHGWEALSDEERLAWDSHAAQRRMKGINYFKQVNLRRIRRGDDPTPVPPPLKVYDARPLLKELNIRNRAGRITLKLRFRRAPDSPRTVWASLPCNCGAKQPRHCPRLGWLPTVRGDRCDITKLYFGKHLEHIKRHGLLLVGKRIFVRLRAETDDGANLYEQVKAIVPLPEVKITKNALRPSKPLRSPFE